ncbi:S8 family serine peptidase [Alteromonas oceanisediminis]|uniref:S8 family serine peptidase n=1 Tax=Alteromonas oceanisediminis TaxID=2836180 RepID=UPI001BD96474|nr:S8 family serine peptidase [Alteromonas oceanisediminis]MBT0587138.1 S8 family serine peptidase [Alteromonas oceanisediminis]
MNHKVTLAVSAALMSMSVHSATQLSAALSSSFDVENNVLQASQPVSVNKRVVTNVNQTRKFIPEPELDNKPYVYIVQLKDSPVALYDGGIKGFPATNPKSSELVASSPLEAGKLNVKDTNVKRYANLLEQRQQSFISKANSTMGNLRVLDTFKYAINGFTVRMTQAEAAKLARLEGVAFVERERIYEMHTDQGPTLIGAPSVWDGSATDSGIGTLGEGVVVGIIDSGINSDHRSFADIADDGYNHTNPLGSGNYIGDCAGASPTIQCNDKLIGVRSYPSVTNVYSDETVFPPGLPANGEDYDGHGTHVASTAAGNILRDVPLYVPDTGEEESDGIPTPLTFPEMSGVAPRANIIAYQVCLPGNNGDTYSGCAGTAILGAQEDAIIDGIDVANYSIGIPGPASNLAWNNASEVGFLSMRNAGIFVAVSAGNSGPLQGTTTKQAPWYTAVAATTHGRVLATPKELTDFSGGDTDLDPIPGSSNSGGITASIVYAGDYENPNDPDGDPAQCLEPFPENTFSGEIVVCDRGAIARVQKAINVAEGGAGGYVLANVTPGSVNSDYYVIPGIHIDDQNAVLLREWLASGTGHTATITPADSSITYDDDAADRVIGFSSRGPNITASTLSPFVAAPGVDIYAAFADQDFGNDNTGPTPTDFNFLSGTSMASPHVAGAAALIKSVHPNWTPDVIRSALMMTSTTAVMDDDGTVADWFDMGAGRIQVDKAVQTGLVMDETASNYNAANPSAGGDPRSLNLPSVTDTDCLGVCTWTRTVTATKAGSWSASGASISGDLSITVTPTSFDLAEGESQELTIEVDVFNAPRDVYSFGIVNLTSPSSPDLHIPVSVEASTSTIPEELEFVAKRDQDSWLVRDRVAVEISNFTINSYGLTKPTSVEGSASQDTNNSDFLDDLEDGLFITTVDVPEDAKRLVANTRNSTSPDLDLYVVIDANEDGIPTEDEIVGSSATASAEEFVDIKLPSAGMYWLIVQNWSASAEDATDTFDLNYAVVDGEIGDNLTVEAPSAVPQLTPFDLRFIWDLEAAETGDMYFGAVDFGTSPDNAGNLGLVMVDLVRGEDDVSVVGDSSTRLEPGDTRTFSVAVDANFTPEDRNYEVSLTLPDGVSLVEDSTEAEVDGDTLSWMVSQPSLLEIQPTYRVSTNATDEQCAIPFGDGSYVNLADFGLGLNSDIDGDEVTGSFPNSVQFYGQEYNGFTLTDDGFIVLDGNTSNIPRVNQLMPDSNSPNAVVAPFWRDMTFDVENGQGATVAATRDGSVVFIEWDNMTPVVAAGEAPSGDVADFQIVFANQPAPGQPSIVFAYDNVTHVEGDDIPTSIGYENASGTEGRTTHYIPPAGSSNDPIGSVANDAVSGTQICFFLEEVPSEPTLLSFTVQVDEGNTGGPIQMVAMSSVTNIPGTVTSASDVFAAVQVEGAPRVTIAGETVANLEVVELQELDLMGEVVDPNGDDVDITWTQISGPAAVIAGNGIADAVLMAPEVEEDALIVLEISVVDENGNESTAIANVTVKNNLAPELAITAPSSVEEGSTIRISVAANDPEGDDVAITIDGVPGSTFTTTAPGTNTDTSISFQVVATDGLNTTTETVTVRVTNKSGGSMGWIALLLIPAIWLRRRKAH